MGTDRKAPSPAFILLLTLACIFSTPDAVLFKANEEPHMEDGNDANQFYTAFIGM